MSCPVRENLTQFRNILTEQVAFHPPTGELHDAHLTAATIFSNALDQHKALCPECK